MKLDNGDSFHLHHHLEAVKVELVEGLQQFAKFMQQTPLIDVAKSCSLSWNNNGSEKKLGNAPLDLFQCQVEYIRNFLLVTKIFPSNVRREMGWKVLRDCDNLWKHVLDLAIKSSLQGKEDDNCSEKDAPSLSQVVSLLILPTGQLILECLEMNTGLLGSDETELVATFVKHAMSMFGESVKFLTSPPGTGLEKPDFLRIMGLCDKLWKFAEHVKKLSACKEMLAESSKLMNTQIEAVEEILDKQMLTLLSSGNGKSFVKFWCELLNTGKQSRICKGLKQISSFSTTFPEVYMMFTSYLHDDWFWKTDTGKLLTPVIICGILQDMSSDKIETRKRAAFVLKLLVTQYSQNLPIFDPSIPETALISLNEMESEEYVKFWDSFFDLHDILNETQLHIVQPVLHKLQIFQEHCSNDCVLVWLPVILKKMINHDNRTVVKQGFEQFLLTGEYLKNQEDFAVYRSLARDFLEKYIMPLIRDHIGWILSDPQEFFTNIPRFGKFLLRLQTCQNFPEFKAGQSILTFLTSSGKCMGPHTILFLVAAFDEILCDESSCDEGMDDNCSIVISEIDNVENLKLLMNQLALLVSNNLTTVGKYFRELLEHRCISIISKVMPFIKQLPKLSLDSFVFTKLVTFFGSISGKVFYHEAAQAKIRFIVTALNDKHVDLLNQLTGGGSSMHDFVKLGLSYTSTIGLLRFMATSLAISNKQKSDNIQKTVEAFTLANSYEILPGSVQGLREFYQRAACKDSGNKSLEILKELCEKLETIDDQCSTETFMSCAQRIEVLSVMSPETWSEVPLPKLESSSSIKMFLLQKLYVLRRANEFSTHVLKDLTVTSGFESVAAIDTINEAYFAVTERNLHAEYHQIKFKLYASIFESCIKSNSVVDTQDIKNVLNIIVDEIEKCDSKGVAAGLLLTKSVIRILDSYDDWDLITISHLLDEIASVGWSLVFELRKSESFWFGVRAFVELITCPYYIKNGFLNKYADLLFEHGETVSGLPLVLVEELVKADFPDELLENVNDILIKAALTGGALPKNNRVTFATWEYLRSDSEDDNDPENFSSDCKSRLLACEKIRSNIERALTSEKGKEEGLKLLRTCVTSILERNEYESVRRKRYFLGSSTHRIKQRIWQLLLILQPHFDFEISKFVLGEALTSLSTDSPQPSVRYMGEWLIILILYQHPEFHTQLFDCLDKCIQKRLGFGAFFSTICLQTSKLIKCPVFYDKALQSLATLTLSQHLTVRIYSQIVFQMIYQRANEMHFTIVVQRYAPVISALSRASMYVSGNCSKLLENVSQDFYVNVFDSVGHYCPEVIFTLLPRLSGMIRDECILEPTTIRKLILSTLPSNSSYTKEQIEALQKVYMDHENSAWHLKTVVADGRELGEEMPDENLLPGASKPQSTEMNYQKKINPWKLLSASEQIEEFANINSKKKCVTEDGLVVVASLLDHLPNLGGLCRTCEIFGVHKYVISSLKFVNDQHFQSLSVSAQNWVNIMEVPARDLESFLFTYSAKGYTILGVEQANESSSLTDFNFPKKSVLLLGNEKLGIPPELLRLVDKCIEIPQVGIIRSLNVHVTGALCIWQYASQNIL